MPLPVIANTMRVSVEGLAPNGHHWANVLHVRKDAAVTYAGAIAIADPLIYAFWNSALGGGSPIKNYMSTAWSMQRIRYTPLDGSSATVIQSHALAGALAGDAMPPQVALCCTMYTAKRGRSYRGRFYLNGWVESTNNSSGLVDAASAAAINTQLAGWLASFVGTTTYLVVASYLHATAEDVTSIQENNVWDTQRRRARV